MKQQIHWSKAVSQCQASGTSYTLVTIVGTVGSSPRSSGTKMVVTSDKLFDTIGGGQLEHCATLKAREMLQNKHTQHIEHYPLAAKLGQCCGGSVNVLFECFYPISSHIAIFGAGHICNALIPIITQLPVFIRLVDSRKDLLDPFSTISNVQCLHCEEPEDAVNYIDSSSLALVMTHDHQLDFSLVKSLLNIDQIPWVGLVGSQIKSNRFRYRLSQQGISDVHLEKLACPVGLENVTGKRPIEVAVSIAGQIISLVQNQEVVMNSSQNKAIWTTLKQKTVDV